MRSMREAGYATQRMSKKLIKDIFKAAVQHAKSQGTERSAVSYERKCGRLKSLFSNYMGEKNNSGAGGESTLHLKPQFFEEMYELEKNSARHGLPSVIDSEKEKGRGRRRYQGSDMFP